MHKMRPSRTARMFYTRENKNYCMKCRPDRQWIDEEEGRPFTHKYTHTHTISANTHKRLKSMRNVKIFYNTEKGRKFSKFLSKKLFTCVYDFTCMYMCSGFMYVYGGILSSLCFFQNFTPKHKIFLVCFCVFIFGGVQFCRFSLPACLPASCPLKVHKSAVCIVHWMQVGIFRHRAAF